MKKLVTIALLCAMLLSCFAGCAMQKGELDVAGEANVAEVAEETLPEVGITSGLKANVDAAKNGTWTNVDKWDGTADISWYAAATDNKFNITTAEQLAGMLALMADGTATFAGWEITLGANLDLDGKEWTGARYVPDTTGACFQGSFDGQNYVIANYTMTFTVNANAFFGSFGAGAELKNVALVNGDYYFSGTDTNNKVNASGIVVGRMQTVKNEEGSTANDISIVNVYSDCNASNGETQTQNGNGFGLIGRAYGDGKLLVSNLQNDGSFNVRVLALAGILGEIYGACDVTVNGCINNGDVKALKLDGSFGYGNVGGIVSRVAKNQGEIALTITNCINNGHVAGTSANAGIFAVVNKGNTGTVTITGCRNTGTITKAIAATANVAEAEGLSVTIENCTNLVMAGYQVTAVGEDNKYDIRFVAAFDDAQAQAAGFVVTAYYKDAEGKQVKVDNVTVYASKVYTSVKGTAADGTELTYAAADYYGEYLYTLVIEGVDAAYTIADGTLEVLVTPFIAENAETVINGSQVQLGEIVIEAPAE